MLLLLLLLSLLLMMLMLLHLHEYRVRTDPGKSLNLSHIFQAWKVLESGLGGPGNANSWCDIFFDDLSE